jgi:hypothetical protein
MVDCESIHPGAPRNGARRDILRVTARAERLWRVDELPTRTAREETQLAPLARRPEEAVALSELRQNPEGGVGHRITRDEVAKCHARAGDSSIFTKPRTVARSRCRRSASRGNFDHGSPGERIRAPYVCALDDRVSRIFGLGLRRTGTIGLGASHCDFRWKLGGEPRTLDSQFDLPGVGQT